MSVSSVKDVSKFIIQESSSPISNLKLQKLLYYVQGWSLALYGRPAFYEEIQAWIHGPVVPAAFYEYKHFRWNPISVPAEPTSLESQQAFHIGEVLQHYGMLTATQLEALSHEESPWLDARAGIPRNESSHNVITHEAMRSFFTAKMNA